MMLLEIINDGACATCGKPLLRLANAFTTGYGEDRDGNRHCYACCGVRDRADMIATGKATLYLTQTGDRAEITNWPGTLRFKAGYVRRGHHNRARYRYDTWFRGPDGRQWHAVQYGDNTQIAHCKRTKEA